MTMAINSGVARDHVLGYLLDTVLLHDLCTGALLTFKPSAHRDPALLVQRVEGLPLRWPEVQDRAEIRQAHAGERVSWQVEAASPATRVDCFSLCFSTDGKGAIALTAIGSPRAPQMCELKAFVSPEVEHLLVRDHIVRAEKPGGPLKDMAEWTWATLYAAKEALDRIEASSNGSPERASAESRLMMKIHELCQYTHIDDGLAEVSSSLLVVTRRSRTGPFTQDNVDALRDVFEWMRPISLSDEDSDRCLDRLKEGGLDIFDAFGEDEHDYADS